MILYLNKMIYLKNLDLYEFHLIIKQKILYYHFDHIQKINYLILIFNFL